MSLLHERVKHWTSPASMTSWGDADFNPPFFAGEEAATATSKRVTREVAEGEN